MTFLSTPPNALHLQQGFPFVDSWHSNLSQHCMSSQNFSIYNSLAVFLFLAHMHLCPCNYKLINLSFKKAYTYIFRSRKIDKKLKDLYLILKLVFWRKKKNVVGWKVATIKRKRKQAEFLGTTEKRKKKKNRRSWPGSSHQSSAVMNPTSIHEDMGSVPDLNQWVKDLAVPWAVV